MCNHGYTYAMHFVHYSKKLMWFSSCIAIMWLFPFGLETMNEQAKIIAKIAASQLDGGDAGGMGPPAQEMRPF